MRKKLPIGIENFEEFMLEEFYYVDKTMLVFEFIQGGLLFSSPYFRAQK